jgi:predicted secreted protein with PEFG-CTERM motif
MDYKAYALMAILLASVASLATFGTASAQSITVETDQTDYTTGDTITISGSVGTPQGTQPVLIRVTDSKGVLVRVDQVNVAADGSYEYSFPAGGLMRNSGEHTVQVTYGSRTEETTFGFTATDTPTTWRNIDLVIGDDEFPVQYMISGSGNSLESLTGDYDTKTVTATINGAADGTLSLRFPATTFDAEEFVAFADGEDAIVDDAREGTTNEIHIDFATGTESIEIVGDFIAPEFGAIAAIVLAIAIVGIIVATARTGKFSFVPRL